MGLISRLINRGCFLTYQVLLFFLSGFIIQFEEDRYQSGTWYNLASVPGNVNSALLRLSPYVNYQFRVLALNDLGSSMPSPSSERYQTNGARE